MMEKSTMDVVSVPRLWPGSTVVCLASGPSLTQADVDACRGRARVIAIKESIRLAPWADVLYACDARWWRHYGKGLSFEGPKYALEPGAAPWAQVLKQTGQDGLELDPAGLRTGHNSGYQAINLAVHLGAKRIVLLGYDMQRNEKTGAEHWFGKHPWPSRAPVPFHLFLFHFPSIVEPLRQAGVEVLNASRESALSIFPRVSLDVALEARAA